MKLLLSQHMLCVHCTTMHQVTVSIYLKPHCLAWSLCMDTRKQRLTHGKQQQTWASCAVCGSRADCGQGSWSCWHPPHCCYRTASPLTRLASSCCTQQRSLATLTKQSADRLHGNTFATIHGNTFVTRLMDLMAICLQLDWLTSWQYICHQTDGLHGNTFATRLTTWW